MPLILISTVTTDLAHLIAMTAHALWPWLPALTASLRAVTALISCTIAAHRAQRYWHDTRHR